MYLDIVYIEMHSKYYVPRNAGMTYNLEWREYLNGFETLIYHIFLFLLLFK